MDCERKDNMKSAREINYLYIMNMYSPTSTTKLCWRLHRNWIDAGLKEKFLFNVSFRSQAYHKPRIQMNEVTSYWHSKPREGLEQVGAEAGDKRNSHLPNHGDEVEHRNRIDIVRCRQWRNDVTGKKAYALIKRPRGWTPNTSQLPLAGESTVPCWGKWKLSCFTTISGEMSVPISVLS